MIAIKIKLVCERFGIDEYVEIDKYYSGDILFKRKTPRRFEFESSYEKENFRYEIKTRYGGWLKNNKSYATAYLEVENE